MRIAIIGGGAAGLAAAISAKRENSSAHVTVYERKEDVAKKILATGNGRCNFTNEEITSSFYNGDNPEFIETFLAANGRDVLLEFMASIGVVPVVKEGYYYPRSEQAAAIKDALKRMCLHLGVTLKNNNPVKKIHKEGAEFLIDAGKLFPADRVILATGGQAAPVLGSDGSGYGLATEMGHHVSCVTPALVPLLTSGKVLAKASGVRTRARATCHIAGCENYTSVGELQITDNGLSGIMIFQLSRHVSKALEAKKRAIIELDFLPEYRSEEVMTRFKEQIERFPYFSVAGIFNSLLPEKLIQALLSLAGIKKSRLATELSEEEIANLLRTVKAMPVTIRATKGFASAQVCAGGVLTEEVDPLEMKSKRVDGLYLVGELLDVDGLCGGYNLHFAFTSGIIAGRMAARKDETIDSNY